MIFINKNPVGRVQNFVFAWAALADAIVRVISLGFLATEFPVSVSRWQTKRHFEMLKRKRK